MQLTETALWATTGVLGLCIASVFPSGIHLIETYIDVTGRCVTPSVLIATRPRVHAGWHRPL